MAYTALNLITDVLVDMGVLADEQTPTASQAAGALVKLNDLLESWTIDKASVYGATEYVLPFVANQGMYTIGIGGNLNIARPSNITQAFIRNNTGSAQSRVDVPLRILNNEEYASLPFKAWTGGFPFLGVWFDQTYPLIKAYVNPIPTGSSYSLVFWDDNSLATLTLFTVLSFPPGYARPIKYALYIELAPGYQVEVPQEILALYRSAKQIVDRNNLQINELTTSSTGIYNIYSNRVYVNRS